MIAVAIGIFGEAAQIPGALGEVVGTKPPARLEHDHPIALLHQSQSGDAATEAATDDDHIRVVGGPGR